jgi:hypothetical protein
MILLGLIIDDPLGSRSGQPFETENGVDALPCVVDETTQIDPNVTVPARGDLKTGPVDQQDELRVGSVPSVSDD